MRRKSIFGPALLVAGVAIAGLAALGIVQSRGSVVAAGGAAFAATSALAVGAAWPSDGRRRGRGFGSHGVAGACGMWDDRADQLVRYVERDLRLSSEQREPWNDLIETLRAEARSWEEVCRSFSDREADKGLVWELAFLESMMKAGAVSAGKLRAAYAALDATLSDEQHAAIDSLLAARHGRAGSGGRRRFGGWH